MSKVDRVEVGEDGTLFIRFLKDDGKWHRTSIPPNVDPDQQMAYVEAHLQSMGHTRIPVSERATIRTKHAQEKAKRREQIS